MSAPAAHAPALPGLQSSDISDGRLRLVLNNTLGAIDAGRQEILRFLAPDAPGARVINRLEVVFEEVIANIVRHGFEAGADQAIVVTVARGPKHIDLVFEDEGRPFDVTRAVDPPRPTSIETAPIGGLGVPLIHKLAAALRYEAVEPGDASCHMAGRPFAPRNRLHVAIATD